MSRHISSRVILHFGAVLLLALLAGCSTAIKVTPITVSQRQAERAWASAAAEEWNSSAALRADFNRQDYNRLVRNDPSRVLNEIDQLVLRGTNAEDLAVLVKLTCCLGATLQRTDPEEALSDYLTAAALGYPYLIHRDTLATNNPFDSDIVQAYNRATAQIVVLLQSLPGGIRAPHVISAGGRSYELEAHGGDADADPDEYDRWVAADDWRLKGFYHHYQSEGVGGCLVAMSTNHEATPFELHEPDEGIFRPATAILDFQPLKPGSTNGPQKAALMFYDPLMTSEAEVEGRYWPLAGDYTLPWAMLLTRTSALYDTRWSGLFQPGKPMRPHRLYLMEPYSPDRIPVILVHGLRSTPLAWEQMSNELLGDPFIRQHFQIWHYLYPTGLPVLTTAADLREEIERVRRMVDPENHDFATHNMIAIGHSMGGLLVHTLVSDSGDSIWNSMFNVPLTELKLSPPELNELRRTFYFQAEPCIKRVIFMSVPHHGSDLANGWLGRYMASRVHLPDELNQLVADLQASGTNLLKPDAAFLFAHGYPSSIAVLSPRTPGLLALANLPVAAPFHSIMGDHGWNDGTNSTDGVVPYWSSHLAGAQSELLVPSNHASNENPQAIAEVKRILLLHLAESGQVN